MELLLDPATTSILSQSDFQQRKKSLIAALQQCGSLEEGMRLHSRILQCNRLRSDQLLMNLLVKMYSNTGRLDHAQSLFDKMPKRNVFSWNIILAAYANIGHLVLAEILFNKMPVKDVVSWNSMIQAYASFGDFNNAFRLFVLMDNDGFRPDRFSIAPLLSCCSCMAMATLIHDVARDSGSDVGCCYVSNELIKLYGRLGRPCQAQDVFDSLPDDHRDAVAVITMITVLAENGHLLKALDLFHNICERNTATWNAILSACSHHGKSSQVFSLLGKMDLEGESSLADSITFVSVVQACSCKKELDSLRGIVGPIHATEVKTALVDAYGKIGLVADARKIFETIAERDVIAWTSMINACSRNGDCSSALGFFRRMQLDGSQPNAVTLSSVFHACSVASRISDTRKIHASLSGNSIELDTVVSNSLIDAYRSCGAVDRVVEVFDRMRSRSVVSWSSVVAAYAQCGCSSESIARFRTMELEGVVPNEVTFVSLIHACSHGGLVEDGRLYFVRMIQDYGIQPEIDHIACLTDLFGRSGKVEEAKEIAIFYSLPIRIMSKI